MSCVAVMPALASAWNGKLEALIVPVMVIELPLLAPDEGVLVPSSNAVPTT